MAKFQPRRVVVRRGSVVSNKIKKSPSIKVNKQNEKNSAPKPNDKTKISKPAQQQQQVSEARSGNKQKQRKVINKRITTPKTAPKIRKNKSSRSRNILPDFKATISYIITNNTIAGTENSVTGLMPTCDRLDFAHFAVRLFEKQSYKNKQLIIIDDGRKPMYKNGDSIPPCIYKYIRCNPIKGNSLIANINMGLEHVNTDYVAVWEDDDWYRHDRLKYQISNIKDKVAHGISYSWYYHIITREYKLFNHKGRASNCATMFKSSWIKKKKYPNLKFADIKLWSELKGVSVVNGDYKSPLFVGIKHGIGAVAGGGHKFLTNNRHKKDKSLSWLGKYVDSESLEFYKRMASKK